MNRRFLVIGASTSLLISLSAGVVVAHTAEQRASLTGANIVPGPGDRDGKGRALIKSASEANTVCYKIHFGNIGRATAAHIHEGAKGEAGPKHIKLFVSSKGKRSPAEGCRHNIDAATIEAMHDNASGYYVDVHTERYPNGAVRGQLRNVE